MLRNLALASAFALGLTTTATAGLPDFAGMQTRAASVIQAHHDHHYHVQYRAPWRERTFDCPIEARSFERWKERDGYRAYTVNHGGHYHVHFGIPDWRTYRTVHSDFVAHRIERELERRGFIARVVHH